MEYSTDLGPKVGLLGTFRAPVMSNRGINLTINGSWTPTIRTHCWVPPCDHWHCGAMMVQNPSQHSQQTCYCSVTSVMTDMAALAVCITCVANKISTGVKCNIFLALALLIERQKFVAVASILKAYLPVMLHNTPRKVWNTRQVKHVNCSDCINLKLSPSSRQWHMCTCFRCVACHRR